MWGEYLQYLGQDRRHKKIAARVLRDTTRNQEKLPSLLSGITGRAEDAHPWQSSGLNSRVTMIGVVQKPRVLVVEILDAKVALQLQHAGVTAVSKGDKWQLTYSAPVPPSGIPFVVGMARPLLEGTPLSRQFTLKMPEAGRFRRGIAYKMDWLELWCWTTAHR